jgi:hypothetical protein
MKGIGCLILDINSTYERRIPIYLGAIIAEYRRRIIYPDIITTTAAATESYNIRSE